MLLVKTTLPFTAEITLRKQENKTILHMLHYIAERKSRKMDIVDSKIPLYNINVEVKQSEAPQKVYLAPAGKEIPFTFENGYVKVMIPEINGHTMLVLE